MEFGTCDSIFHCDKRNETIERKMDRKTENYLVADRVSTVHPLAQPVLIRTISPSFMVSDFTKRLRESNTTPVSFGKTTSSEALGTRLCHLFGFPQSDTVLVLEQLRTSNLIVDIV